MGRTHAGTSIRNPNEPQNARSLFRRAFPSSSWPSHFQPLHTPVKGGLPEERKVGSTTPSGILPPATCCYMVSRLTTRGGGCVTVPSKLPWFTWSCLPGPVGAGGGGALTQADPTLPYGNIFCHRLGRDGPRGLSFCFCKSPGHLGSRLPRDAVSSWGKLCVSRCIIGSD